MSVIFVIIAAVSLLAVSSNAIQCFTCNDNAANCASGIMMTSCPLASQFCKLEWTATTDIAVQTCATSSECPALSVFTKRQASLRSALGADGSTVQDINNCCNYDGCNCVGTQCDSIAAASNNRLDILAVVFAITLFFLR